MMKLLLGGTSDSTAILEVLDRLKIDVTSSVVTDYGRHLASKYGQPVIQGRLTAEDRVACTKENEVEESIGYRFQGSHSGSRDGWCILPAL